MIVISPRKKYMVQKDKKIIFQLKKDAFFPFTNTEQNLYYQHNLKKNVSLLLQISEIWLQICHFKTELPGTLVQNSVFIMLCILYFIVFSK